MSDEPTIGEVYRLCQTIDARTVQIQKDATQESHSLRGYINSHALMLERHEGAIKALNKDVEGVQQQHAGAKTWIAGVVSGGLVGGLGLLWEKLTK